MGEIFGQKSAATSCHPGLSHQQYVTECCATGGFAGVLGPEADNSLVFERAFKPKLQTVLSGGTASLLCYGYTGSGKTHTVLGSGGEEGLYYKAVGELLSRLKTEQPDKQLFLMATACEVFLHISSWTTIVMTRVAQLVAGPHKQI